MRQIIEKILKEEVLLKEAIEHFGRSYSYKDMKSTSYNGNNYTWFNRINEIPSEGKLFDFSDDAFEPQMVAFTKLEGKNGNFIFNSTDLKPNKNGDGLSILTSKLVKKYPDISKNSENIDYGQVAMKIKKDTAKRYQKKIRQIFREIFTPLNLYGVSDSSPDCETNEGVINFKGINYGRDNKLVSNWSVLNYFDTNSGVIEYLLEKFMESDEGKQVGKVTDLNFDTTVNKFVKWLYTNKDSLFNPKSKVLDDLEEINLRTIKIGVQNEQRAIPVLFKLHNIDDSGITQYCPGSKQDTLYGRDFKINTEENLHYQIKPLRGLVKVEGDNYIIRTSNFKKYGNTVQRLMFISDNNYYVFNNGNYTINNYGDVVTFTEKPIAEGKI
jgi:hypothetical protein